ncbi:hypothetical protein D9O36_20615 [Zobellia amurskyensis]|uniref:Uncharacterized protein n=1 Tax=Zobellia amurskyensis TaxID=248905 RepID=A0A7X2ZXP1_9FLAO|nr:hypothetical protein [Zobellia amurskyensis]MUH38259.1 hypothetical protein [Zobellia amurskyensis]
MEKIFTLLFLFISLITFSQEQFFVGENPELLIGKQVTLIEGMSYYSGFYKDSKLKRLLYKDGTGNNPDKLKGLKFTVTETMANPNKYALGKDLVLVIESEETGTAYYAYDPKHADLFSLNVVDGFAPPEGFLCQKLKSEKDKYSSKTTISTPYQFEYSISKIQEDGKAIIYLILQSYGTTLNAGKKGLKILLSDDTVITKPEVEIKYKSASGTKGWTYSCIFPLHEEDITSLTSKTITDYSLYIYDREMKKSNALELREYLKCMTE